MANTPILKPTAIQIMQGILFITIGTFLLLHTFGIFEKSMRAFLITLSIVMIIYGFITLYGFIKPQQ